MPPTTKGFPFLTCCISVYNEDPIYEAKGQIWDIDAFINPDDPDNPSNGFEQWKVTARDPFGGNPVEELSPVGLVKDDPDSLDGKPWEFSFASARGIGSIEIEWVDVEGSKEKGIGLAFDNFEYTAVPIPGAIWLFGSGILGMVFIRRKLKN